MATATTVKATIDFPNPIDTPTVEGVIYVGGELTVPNLILAYSLGIFPWPHPGYPLLWFCPDDRGVLFFKDLHIPKSLKKWIKKNEAEIKITINQNFQQVMSLCQTQIRAGQKGSWITSSMKKNYTELHKQGGALSLECWIGEELVSGIYGVKSKNYFSCESMFFRRPNASKFAFIKLVEYLRDDLGFEWMDLQMVTPVSESFGAKYITKKDFLNLISI